MPRPGIIRADTIDLQQDKDHPSAKDHTSTPNAIATGSIAPSQANALMNVAQEQAHEKHDMMAHNGINGSNGGSYIPDTISPYDHDPHYNGEEDDINDEDDVDMDMHDGMSSSPSISDEDIDFEFVYALHTFIATVEGQANATKGDTMVLLDDSNSYWWLVRVVKDSSIGYLPAEHIETPSERLARLNKHRNVDLSTPMLGDNQEKSKNILKKAIRRRAAKTVQFAPPTYVEASDVDYSTDEDDIEGGYYSNEDEGAALDDDELEKDNRSIGGSTLIQDDEITPIDAPDTAEKSKALEDKPKEKIVEKQKEAEKEREKAPIKPFAKSEARNSEEIFDGGKDTSSQPENKVVKPRNTDSVLFGDADSEPRRITLTPKLVRDDDITTTPGVIPVKPKTSFDRIGKREDAFSPPPTGKNEKVKKERKGTFLGSLFKKRKNNSKDDEIDDFLHSAEKKSSESLRDDSSGGRPSSSRSGGNSFEQSSPQLQQQQIRAQQNEKLLQNPSQRKGPELSTRTPNISTVRTIDSVREDEEEEEERPLGIKFGSRSAPIDQQQSTIIGNAQGASPKMAQSPASSIQTPVQQKPDFNISPISAQSSVSRSMPGSVEVTPILTSAEHPGARADGYYAETPDDLTPHEPPSLIPDNGSGSEDNNPHDNSPIDANYPDTPVAQPGSPSSLIWSEAALNAYLDDENQDIRDFLVVVNHRTEAATVKSHPQITPLFADANSKLQDMTSRLDSMLDQWMRTRR